MSPITPLTATISASYVQGEQVSIELREAIKLGPLRPLVLNIVRVELCTLKRRLQEKGNSIQMLLDNPALAINQVAEAIGYADPANFARAFAKWTGMSPRAGRQRQASSGPI